MKIPKEQNLEETLSMISEYKDFSTIRSGLDHMIVKMEREKHSVDDIGPEFTRLAVAIAIAINGPADTMIGLNVLLAQLANAFPDDWQIARAKLTSAGNA